MDENQKMNVANGVVSGVVLLCGIVFAALMGPVWGMTVLGSMTSDSMSAVWAYCFAYIIPGIIGIAASATKRMGLYITHLVFCILTLIVMGFVIYYAINTMIVVGATDESCLSYGDLCTCKSFTPSSLNRSCDLLQKLFVTSVVILTLAWGLTLANCVMSGILGNKPKVTTTVFMQQVPQTTVVQLNTSRHAPPKYMPPQYTHMPPKGTFMTSKGDYMTPQGAPPPKHHDTAELVNNVEY